MSRKLIWGDFTATHAVKVYKDSETGEFVARLFIKPSTKAYEPADYFATDKDDAISSGKDMLRRASSTNPRRPRLVVNRWGHSLQVGMPVLVRHPRATPGELPTRHTIAKFETSGAYAKAYGPRVILESGGSASIDDVSPDTGTNRNPRMTAHARAVGGKVRNPRRATLREIVNYEIGPHHIQYGGKTRRKIKVRRDMENRIAIQFHAHGLWATAKTFPRTAKGTKAARAYSSALAKKIPHTVRAVAINT